MLPNPLDSGEAPVAPLRVINPQQWRVEEQPGWQSEKKKRSRLTSLGGEKGQRKGTDADGGSGQIGRFPKLDLKGVSRLLFSMGPHRILQSHRFISSFWTSTR